MWQKKGLIYKVQNKYGWDCSHAHVVCADVLENEHIIRFVFSTRNAKNQCLPTSIDVDLNDFSVVRDMSSEPLFDLGKVGTFDDCGIMPTWLLREGEHRHLFYIGWTVRNTIPYHNSLGYAHSRDGMVYSRVCEGPILTSTPFEPYFVASAAVLKMDSEYWMWYLSCVGWENVDGKEEPLYDIKFAKSKDLLHWERQGITCIHLKDGEGGISRPTVILEDGVFKMWYSYRGRRDFKHKSIHSYRIGYAESIDGIHWVRKDESAGIDLSESGWDSDMIEYPLVVKINSRKLLFYNGNGFGKSGFGYAEWVE